MISDIKHHSWMLITHILCAIYNLLSKLYIYMWCKGYYDDIPYNKQGEIEILTEMAAGLMTLKLN